MLFKGQKKRVILTHLFLWVYTFNYVSKTSYLEIIFISAIIDNDFIPEWNLDPCLHDSNSIFHSGSGVQGIQNKKLNELDPEWVETQRKILISLIFVHKAFLSASQQHIFQKKLVGHNTKIWLYTPLPN